MCVNCDCLLMSFFHMLAQRFQVREWSDFMNFCCACCVCCVYLGGEVKYVDQVCVLETGSSPDLTRGTRCLVICPK